jgi:hypothetical protein
MKKLTVLLIVFLYSLTSFAQGYQWWADNVRWDGVTYWKKYIIYSPYYLGPNALPVPSLPNGKIDSLHSIGLSGNFHTMRGDQTVNAAIYGTYVLVKDVIAFDFYMVPYEYFNQSHALKTERKVFYVFYNSKEARGDLIVNTKIQLFKKLQPKFNLMLRAGYRFATSSNYAAARYTDAPGYTFDLNASKPIGKKQNLLLKGMLGFYSWQLNEDLFEQNDAVLFGFGTELHLKKLTLDLYTAGYLGYLKQRKDKPVVLRMGLQYKIKKAALFFNAQQGVRHFRYLSLETGFRRFFTAKPNKR